MSAVSVIILTHNEERHIERAILSVKRIASEIFVIDSGSTDNTIKIASDLGAVVLYNKWKNYATQFQWAIDNASATADWVMRLDADEILESDLVDNLLLELPRLPASVTGINLNRKHIFMGKWIRHGGRYPLVLLRIWRRGAARIENRWMDEHIVLLEGKAINIEGGFSDINLNDLTFFTDKHNKYATREAIDILNQKYGFFPGDDGIKRSQFEQATIKRRLKEKVYNHLPFFLGPLSYFLYRYFWQLGILDGLEGTIYHGLQGLWYRFLVNAKVVELEQAIKGLKTKEEMVQRLGALTGLNLATKN